MSAILSEAPTKRETMETNNTNELREKRCDTVALTTEDQDVAAPTGFSRLKWARKSGGLIYATMYGIRQASQRFLDWLDRQLVRIEQRKCLIDSWTINAKRHSAAENKTLWNQYDWTKFGEEWTKSGDWKERVVRDWMVPYIPENGRILEIGPGGGRWTEVLQKKSERLAVLDVAETPIELCRKRFGHCTNIDYFVGDGRNIPLPDSAVDGIWSYDVFVHIAPSDVRGYFHEFRRILKPGTYAVIHHAGAPLPVRGRRPGWRSDLTDEMVVRFAAEAGLEIVKQTTELVNAGDLLTVLRKS